MPEPRKEPAVAPVRVVVNQPSPNAKPRIDDALATRF
jgi:hypothetical protein